MEVTKEYMRMHAELEALVSKRESLEDEIARTETAISKMELALREENLGLVSLEKDLKQIDATILDLEVYLDNFNEDNAIDLL